MSRDYKHRATHRRKRNPVSPWIGLIAGLLIGLFVAFLLYIRMITPESPPPQAEPTEIIPGTSAQPDGHTADEKQVDTIPPPPKPRFDFYTILPEMEVIIPEQEIKGEPEQGVKQVKQPGTYFLQAGSFRNASQADRFKAELALLGLETSIQKVTINNKDTYHRVRVGPYHDLDELNKARRILSSKGIESTLVKIKG
jgi:cell division protein FtsN